MDYKQCCLECQFHFFDEEECPNCEAIRFVENLKPTCEECDKEVEEWEDLEMPFCSAHRGDCYELMICPECRKEWQCDRCNGLWTGLFVTAEGRLCYDCLYEPEFVERNSKKSTEEILDEFIKISTPYWKDVDDVGEWVRELRDGKSEPEPKDNGEQ